MFFTLKFKNLIFIFMLIAFAVTGLYVSYTKNPVDDLTNNSVQAVALMKKTGNIVTQTPDPEDFVQKDKDFIKWVDFKITSSAMKDAMKVDIEGYGNKKHISWIDVLACLGTKYGGDFTRYKKSDLNEVVQKLTDGKKPKDICAVPKYFDYYKNAYTAVLGEYLGEYTTVSNDGKEENNYGLKVFSPIADGYYFSHFDDFGAGRSYGYKRRHLGHDLMTGVGTPVIAIESGYVEALGWNQYGGWRIGIRSFDKKRYYYYAHLRKDHPYAYMLAEGSVVKAGDVIGYVGMTGYSAKENVNNINTPHLHFGIQLIFDESQKDGNGEIWIDCYEITQFLATNKSAVYKDQEKNEYFRKTEFFESSVENME